MNQRGKLDFTASIIGRKCEKTMLKHVEREETRKPTGSTGGRASDVPDTLASADEALASVESGGAVREVTTAAKSRRHSGRDTIFKAAAITFGTNLMVSILNQVLVVAAIAQMNTRSQGVQQIHGTLQWVGLATAAIAALAIGYLVGKTAPKNALRGILAGNALAFLIGQFWMWFALTRFSPVAPPATMFITNFLTGLLWTGAMTANEVVVARWVAKSKARQ